MKTELPVIAALAAVLACTGGKSDTACEPGGCWMMPPDFDRAAETLREKAAKDFTAPANGRSERPNRQADARVFPAASE